MTRSWPYGASFVRACVRTQPTLLPRMHLLFVRQKVYRRRPSDFRLLETPVFLDNLWDGSSVQDVHFKERALAWRRPSKPSSILVPKLRKILS